MNWSIRMRQFHRWVAIAFTLTVILNFVALGQSDATRMKLAYLPLLPLGVLFLTGLYLFALPYVLRRRGSRVEHEP